jgi:hypothetical protein
MRIFEIVIYKYMAHGRLYKEEKRIREKLKRS